MTSSPHPTADPTAADGLPLPTNVALKDTMVYRYAYCQNLTAEEAKFVPLCMNSTDFMEYNVTDEEILQVQAAGGRDETRDPAKTNGFARFFPE